MEFWSRRETCENRGSQPIAAKPWRDYGQPQDRQNEDQKEHILRRVSRTDRFLMRKRDLAPEAETAGRQASGSFKLRDPAELQNQVGTHPTACCDSSNKQERRTVGNIWTLRTVLPCIAHVHMTWKQRCRFKSINTSSQTPILQLGRNFGRILG